MPRMNFYGGERPWKSEFFEMLTGIYRDVEKREISINEANEMIAMELPKFCSNPNAFETFYRLLCVQHNDVPEPNMEYYGYKASDTVRELIYLGKKVQAIKQFREETGIGLKEAKSIVEEFEAQHLKGGNVSDEAQIESAPW